MLASNVVTRGWSANLTLKFSGREDKTIITYKKHEGPLVIQKPFYPEQSVCHVYLLHPPGGVVGGDEISLNIDINNHGHTLVTTPGAAKFYRSSGKVAKVKQILKVESGSKLEWMPQETILFSGCEVEMRTIVQLEGNASFIGWEILCLGRPASEEFFDNGEVRQNFEIWRDKKPLMLDRSKLAGNDDVLTAMWGMQEYTVTGTMMLVNANKEMLELVRENTPVMKSGLFSVTLIDDVLVCRSLAHQAEHIRNAFVHVWKILRFCMFGKVVSEPRIWAT